MLQRSRRSKSRGPKGSRDKSRDKSQTRGKSSEKIKCNHCGTEGHIKKFCYAFKRKLRRGQKTHNNRKNDNMTNTTTTLDDEVPVVSCEDEGCLNIANDHVRVAGDQIEWVVDTVASYHVVFSRKMFTTYKIGDFGTVKMGNSSHSKIVRICDICIETDTGCTLTLKDV